MIWFTNRVIGIFFDVAILYNIGISSSLIFGLYIMFLVNVHKKALDIAGEDFDLAVRVFLGGPEDFVGVVVFLPSEAPIFITGQTIYFDGGRTIP